MDTASASNMMSPLLGLADILQVCCLGQRTGQIEFRSLQSTGYVMIQGQVILHAVCGFTAGEEALYQMLAWAPGTYVFTDDVEPLEKTLNTPWMYVLMEGARRADSGDLLPQTLVTSEPPAHRVAATAGHLVPRIEVQFPDKHSFTYDLIEVFTYAGRSDENQLYLPHPSVSNRHCLFEQVGTVVELKDLNSSNGTLVDGVSISSCELKSGDTISLGDVLLRFEIVSIPFPPPETEPSHEVVGVPKIIDAPFVLSPTPEMMMTTTALIPHPRFDQGAGDSLRQIRDSIKTSKSLTVVPKKTGAGRKDLTRLRPNLPALQPMHWPNFLLSAEQLRSSRSEGRFGCQ